MEIAGRTRVFFRLDLPDVVTFLGVSKRLKHYVSSSMCKVLVLFYSCIGHSAINTD